MVLQVWYAVAPGTDRKRFENLARQLFPKDAASCSNFLRHKTVLITPALLRHHGIPIVTVSSLLFCLVLSGAPLFFCLLVPAHGAPLFSCPLFSPSALPSPSFVPSSSHLPPQLAFLFFPPSSPLLALPSLLLLSFVLLPSLALFPVGSPAAACLIRGPLHHMLQAKC